MNYDLRKPCGDCPFRSDVKPYLNSDRVREIQRSLDRGEFSCHKTNSHNDDGETMETNQSQHCAGALILKEKLGESSQMMRICERLGMYDHTKLVMDSPIYDSFEEMADAQLR